MLFVVTFRLDCGCYMCDECMLQGHALNHKSMKRMKIVMWIIAGLIILGILVW